MPNGAANLRLDQARLAKKLSASSFGTPTGPAAPAGMPKRIVRPNRCSNPVARPGDPKVV